MTSFHDRIAQAGAAIRDADFLLIGGGAGLSDAAGLKYSGSRFTDAFAPFIRKFGMTDLYTSSFFPFETEEERWAYWALHVGISRYDPPATQLYSELLELVREKALFVITTNVDHQFGKAGFSAESIWAVQGDYGLIQCARACHTALYDNEGIVRSMRESTNDCRIPASLVPHCPGCGGPMDIHIRKDDYFVEDESWQEAGRRYVAFLQEAKRGRMVLLELGVGFNTPAIIRNPFERMLYLNHAVNLIRMNAWDPLGPKENAGKTISFTEDMAQTVTLLLKGLDG
ncbi:MAG: Sir2 silent information regulator family NAD-dependent deacetylase [Holophaga sp.]|nr:Sir2 silent information regulator family NAD-dependent deacetylase [Holophaga sp.]